uniref:Uncharacterized protein n=1 Tax=Glossina brevipalpis TaxID=37001 RepID=A0A1A9WMQ2_9MUSC
MGGIEKKKKSLKTAEGCNAVGNSSWQYIASMMESRVDFGLCSYDSLIYAVGGKNRSTVELYNPATNKWCEQPDMPEMTTSCTYAACLVKSMCSLAANQNEISWYRFDPRESQWYQLHRMVGILAAWSTYLIHHYDVCHGNSVPKHKSVVPLRTYKERGKSEGDLGKA